MGLCSFWYHFCAQHVIGGGSRNYAQLDRKSGDEQNMGTFLVRITRGIKFLSAHIRFSFTSLSCKSVISDLCFNLTK